MKQKGSAVRGTLRAIASLHGDPVLAEVMARMPEEDRRLLQPVVLAASWYPISSVAAVHVAVRDVIGKGSWEASYALALESSRQDFSGVHSAFLRTLSPDAVWGRTQAAWDHYHSQGRAQWISHGKGTAVGFVDGVEGFNEGMWNAVAGRMQTLLQMVGLRAAIVEPKQPTSTSVRFEATWLG